MDRPLHILLVDDDALVLEMLKTHLQFAGYRVTMADNCRQAADTLRQRDPVDLMVLDYLMPEGLGTELLEAMGVDDSLQRPRVIMSSSLIKSAGPSWEARVKRLPEVSQSLIRGYVHKPYTFDTMDSTLQAVLTEKWSGDYRQDEPTA